MMTKKPSHRVVKDIVAAAMASEEVDRVLRGRKSILPVSVCVNNVAIASVPVAVTEDSLLKSDVDVVESADYDIGMSKSGGAPLMISLICMRRLSLL